MLLPKYNSLPVNMQNDDVLKYYRILELLKDIDIFELRSIVNNLYDAKCDERRRLIEIMKTLKGKNGSESD